MRRTIPFALLASVAIIACATENGTATQSGNLTEDVACASPSLESLTETLRGDGESLASYVDPTRGVYVITRPGAMDDVEHHADFDDIVASGNAWILEALEGPACELSSGMPALGCHADEPYPSGCFHEAVVDYGRMTAVASFRQDHEEASYSDEEMHALATAESQIRARVALADAKVTLYFGRIDGQWVLLVIDAAEQDCGA